MTLPFCALVGPQNLGPLLCYVFSTMVCFFLVQETIGRNQQKQQYSAETLSLVAACGGVVYTSSLCAAVLAPAWATAFILPLVASLSFVGRDLLCRRLAQPLHNNAGRKHAEELPLQNAEEAPEGSSL
jgi:hypothetical protein